MKITRTARLLWLFVVTLVTSSGSVALLYAKDKSGSAGPDDPTYRLFRMLDNFHGGKLTDFCLLADTYTDPSQPGRKLQHVLQADYDKNRFFGRFRMRVRGVSQRTPAQLKEYTPEQIYGFGSEVEKFEKINPGPLGETGDLYFCAAGNGPLTPVPITDDARRQYELFLTQYILPALEKGSHGGPGAEQEISPRRQKV